MRQKRDDFKLTISHFKILQTVDELNKIHLYPTSKGVNNILMGKLDRETRKYADIKTYATLISFPGRKLCSYILNMTRRGYLSYIYDKKSDAMYLRITEKGEGEILHYEKRHKSLYRKKEPHHKPEIVEIK